MRLDRIRRGRTLVLIASRIDRYEGLAREPRFVVPRTGLHHPVEQREIEVLKLRAAARKHWIEAVLAPLCGRLDHVHSGALIVLQVDRIRVLDKSTSLGCPKGGELEVAGRPQATVTGDTALIEDRLYFRQVGGRRRGI